MKAKFDGSLREMAVSGTATTFVSSVASMKKKPTSLSSLPAIFTRLPLPLSVLPGVSFALVVLVNYHSLGPCLVKSLGMAIKKSVSFWTGDISAVEIYAI